LADGAAVLEIMTASLPLPEPARQETLGSWQRSLEIVFLAGAGIGVLLTQL
jgi:hypothetical protein